MKKNSSTYIIALLLIVALMASVALVVKKQDTRKGAFFAEGQMYFAGDDEGGVSSSNPINAEVGDDVDVHLFVASADAKVSQVRSVFCYGSELRLRGESVELSVEANTTAGFLSEVISIPMPSVISGPTCINLTVISMASDDRLKSGVVRIATVKFKAVVAGAGMIDIDGDESEVVGVNSDGNDKVIRVGVVDKPYNISGPVGPTNTPGPTAVPTAVPTAGPTAAPPTAGPTAVPTAVPATSWVVPFQVSFSGLRNAGAVCGQGWPVDVIVMGNGKTQVYTNVSLTKTEDKTTGGEVIFTGRAALGEDPGVGSENLAVFVRGPMHLQVKYAEDGQSAFYGQAGGQVGASREGTNRAVYVYDFSAYPILAGDVTGETAGEPDGRVNGMDFSYVKSKIKTDRTPLSDGDRVNGDFDGDCWIGNVDLAILMLTLKDKQDQLY